MRRGRGLAFVAALAFAAEGCDGIVGLEPPGTNEGDPDGGDEASGPEIDAFAPTDATVDSDVSNGSTSREAQQSSFPVPSGSVTGIALAGDYLYLLENGDLYGMNVASGFPEGDAGLLWTGQSMDPPLNVMAFCASSTGVYVATSSEILNVGAPGVTATKGPAPPTTVVNTAAALPGLALGQVNGIATDGSNVFWTQQAFLDGGSAPLLLRHDLNSPSTSATVVHQGSLGDAFHGVAVDAEYVYTLGTDLGAVYAVPKGEDDGGAGVVLAQSALFTAPIAALRGEVYFVGVASFGSSAGPLDVTSVGDDGGSPLFGTLQVSTFAIDSGNLFFASGPNLSYWQIGTQTPPQMFAGTQDGPNIAGVAAANGLVAFYDSDAVWVLAEPQ